MKIKQNNKINVTLLASTGIIIEADGIKFLIDGLNKKISTTFSGLSAEVFADLCEAKKSLYKNINYLIFTHLHEDHFYAEHIKKYLESNKVDGFFAPELLKEKYSFLSKKIEQNSAEKYFFDLSLGEKRRIELSENLSLEVFSAVHAGEQYADVENYCYLINFAGRKVFIISDSDYDSEYFSKMLKNEDIEAAFINPLFLNNKKGREVITEAIKAKRLIVYHIPFADDDKYRMRNMVSRDAEKYKDKLPEINILWNELQSLTF